MGTLYPNTFESGKFCSVNDSLTNPNIFRLLSFTSEKNLSRLKSLTTCGYLHLAADTHTHTLFV